MTRRPPFVAVLVFLTAFVVAGTLALASILTGRMTPSGQAFATIKPSVPTPTPTPRPVPGHEVYGFVPYWEMDDGIAAHLARTNLTTLALFSVTNRRDGTLNETQNGYKRINGPIGRQLVREAHDRGIRVELVFTSFGLARNERLFGGPIEAQDAVIASLAGLVDELGFDGVNVDVELLDGALVEAYGEFVHRLRTALRADDPKAEVSVATTANFGGAAMAVAASEAGADRTFLMGYDYHWSGSAPGASSPIERIDGDERDLVWSLDLYESMGVPVQRTLLGLPLYGMAWAVDSGEPDASQIGDGDAWIPSDHLSVLRDPAIVPELEAVEQVQIYRLPTVSPDGLAGWQVVYVDSPATLAPKLALADDRGLAGAGFWAIGYERGMPDFTALINRFREGKLAE